MNGTTDNKVCPHCAETIKEAAKVCPHCRYWQKKWSLQNPTILISIWIIIWIVVVCFLGVFFDEKFGSKEQFATYRDDISVVNSQFSHRIAGSNLMITVVGTLTNRSDVGWKDVSVEAQFTDKSGKLFDAITANADDYRGVTILPRGEAAFKIEGKAARPESDYDTYKVYARWAKDVNALWP
jgi:hypothetical protein